jgi:uncharacterized protein (TIGR03437 family)
MYGAARTLQGPALLSVPILVALLPAAHKLGAAGTVVRKRRTRYLRLDQVSFSDSVNGWAVGSSESFLTSTGYNADLGCIIHTTDGGKTWTDTGTDVCGFNVTDYKNYPNEYTAIKFLDTQNGWALAGYGGTAGASTGHVQLAHTADGGKTWSLVDTGIAGSVNVGFAIVIGAIGFADAQHGCFVGWEVVGCTSDGGAHWTKGALDCGKSSGGTCFLSARGMAFVDSQHGWIAGADEFPPHLYQTTDGGAHWTVASGTFAGLEGVQFLNPSAGWLAGDGGFLARTNDGGATWQPVSTGVGFDLFGLSFPDAQRGWMAGDYGAILNYAGDTSAGKPAVYSATNGASYFPRLAPAAWISIFGANLSTTTRSWAGSDFNGNKLPTSLDGVTVLVNNRPAYLSYISPTQINLMLPDGVAPGPVSIQVTNAAGASGVLTMQEASYSPALFRLGVEGGYFAIAQTADGNLVGDYTIGQALGIPSKVRPARPGEVITLYGTGFGPTTPALPSGTLVASPAPLASTVTFRIGGAPAVVRWAGLIAPGLYQFNVQVPTIAAGDVVIVAEIGGYRTQADSAIWISAQ